MSFRKQIKRSSPATIPLLYAFIAIAAGLSFPRIEASLGTGLASGVSISTATAIYSAIASGMLALTGIVFSLAFVMVQFSATAYSPRLVFWIVRDPVLSHALGVFTATFLYAIGALSGLDRGGLQRAPLISGWVEICLLFASVALFIALIQRIGVLQISRMLVFTGDLGRHSIHAIYQPLNSAEPPPPSEPRRLVATYTLRHHGSPRTVQAFDTDALVRFGEAHNSVIVVRVAVGDTVRESTALLQASAACSGIDEPRLRRTIELGGERSFEQDPKYAVRLLVDIAIRALSPAVNDPSTAVQALDQIEDLLLRLGRSRLNIAEYSDSQGILRLIVPVPEWDDFLRLALDEILFYGATSTQVTRRIMALLTDLLSDLPEIRRSSLLHWEEKVRATIQQSLADDEAKTEALVEDRQGFGISSRLFTSV